MRADRLVSLVLLLRQRGRMSASALAADLEVSPRTVLRDIDALSSAGVPIYADRGRYGGFSLLPGFRTELAGLSHDEALALLAAGSGRGGQLFGLSSALASAMRKVVDALPTDQQGRLADSSSRFLVEPERDLLSRRATTDNVPEQVMRTVRAAVLGGWKLRIHYASSSREPGWQTVDPLGLVTVRDRTYLLATQDGEDRTYRLSRTRAAEKLGEPAQRPDEIDLDRLWEERRGRFLADDHLTVHVRVRTGRRDELLSMARAVHAEEREEEGWSRLELDFEDLRHAVWAIWQLDTGAEALSPEDLRSALCDRAAALVERYQADG